MKQFIFIYFLFSVAQVFAQPINYQGKLSDKAGASITGDKNFSLSIYDDKTGGKLIYEEAVGTVAVKDGLYSFNFGESGKSVATATETIATADGQKQVFNYMVNNLPILGGIKISGGGYSWTEAGSSDAGNFTAAANKESGSVTAIFLTGSPEAGQEIAVEYNHTTDGVMDALARKGQAWLEITVAGEALSPRERLVAVPFALFADRAKAVNYSALPDSLLLHNGSDTTAAGATISFVVDGGGRRENTGKNQYFNLYKDLINIPENTKSLLIKFKHGIYSDIRNYPLFKGRVQIKIGGKELATFDANVANYKKTISYERFESDFADIVLPDIEVTGWQNIEINCLHLEGDISVRWWTKYVIIYARF